MKKLTLLVVILVLAYVASLTAIEQPLRQAYDLESSKLHIRTADDCEIVFWSDVPSGNRDIFAQKINSNGQLLWDEPIALVANPGDQKLLDVVPNSDNSFIILWEEYDIYTITQLKMQKYTSNGQRLWLEGGVTVSDISTSIDTALLVPNNIGGAFVVFHIYDSPNDVKGQNLDLSGNQLWQAGGISLFSDTNIIGLFEAIKDNEGGLIVNIYKGTQYVNHLLRVDADGLVIANPMFQASLFPSSYFQIKGFGTNQILLYNLGYFGISCTMAKIDYQGNLLTSIVTCPMNPSDQIEDSKIEFLADGGLVVAWSKDTSPKGLYMRKFDTNLAPVWQPEAIQIASSDNLIWYLSLSPAGNNIYISWNEGYVYNASPPNCKAQMVNPQGISAWEAGGKVLGLGSEYNQSIAFSDRCLFLWNAPMEGNYKLQRQVVGSGGESYLASGGATIVQSLQGLAYAHETHAIGDRFMTLWTDSRRQQQQIYYQICNINQDIILAQNGLALNPQETYDEFFISSVKTVDNSVAILYGINENIGVLNYLQLINSNGEKQYPGRGLFICNNNAYYTMQLGYDGTDFYVGWTLWEEGIGTTIKGQRISNGGKMWGENGRVIISNQTTNSNLSLAALKGSNYMWNQTDQQNSPIALKALRVDANGDPALGWDISGISIVNPGDTNSHFILSSGLVGTDLIVFVQNTDATLSGAKAQKINLNGVKLWSDDGLAIDPSAPYINIYDVIYDNKVSFIYGKENQDDTDIYFQQITADGSLVLPPTGALIASQLNNCYDAKLKRFANGSFVCRYSDYDGILYEMRDVFIRQISALGVPMGNSTQVFYAARYQQRNLTMNTIGNQAMLAWSDDRAGIINGEVAVTGIWTNTYDSLPVALDDPVAAAPAIPVLNANYPNPFNPTTTISFTLPHSGDTSLEIFNLKGQLVKELYRNTDLALGDHSCVWDGKDKHGNPVSSGIYCYRLSFAGRSVNRKMVMLK